MSAAKEALARMRAARETGVSCVEQYKVPEPKKIIQEVSEKEYRDIVEQRRSDWVVGDSGYVDNGKELWQGPEAAKQRARADEAERKLLAEMEADSGKKPKAKAKPDSAPSPPSGRGALLGALQKGAAAVSNLRSSPNKKENKVVDDLLAQMCEELEAESVASPPKRKLETPPEPACKRLETVEESAKIEQATPPKETAKPSPAMPPSPEPARTAAQGSPQPTAGPGQGTPPRQEAEPKETKTEPCEIKLVKPVAAPTGCKPLLDDKGGLWFFFIDAVEDDRSSPPRVYLFGKVLSASKEFVSCCLVVEKLERCVHLLLKGSEDDEQAAQEAAQAADAEFDALCQKHPAVKKLRSKLKWRNYAFEKALQEGLGNLPFLKVLCDASGGLPPLGPGTNFSHAFGVQTSLLERLLLSRRIMGPGWYRLLPGSFYADPARLSYCGMEFRINPRSLQVARTESDRAELAKAPAGSPPLRVMSCCLQTLQPSAQMPHEVLAVACTAQALSVDAETPSAQGHWAAVRRLEGSPFPRDAEKDLAKKGIQCCNNELALLTAFMDKVQQFDPDVIAGHNAYAFDLDVMAGRMNQLKIQQWHRLGRLRRKERVPRAEGRQGGFWVGSKLVAGRLVCDVMLQSKDLLPKMGCYDLPNLAREQLGAELKIVEPEAIASYYSSARDLETLVQLKLRGSELVAQLTQALQILPLTRQLTNLAGNLWNASLQNKRAERNELLLCHEFHRKKFVLPDKENATQKKKRMHEGFGLEEDEDVPAQGKRKAAYSGGLVLEPKAGLYDDFVMLLDFNSLYPSIIQEHNICFTTVDRPDENEVAKAANEAQLLAQTHAPDAMAEEGILPQVAKVAGLTDSRGNLPLARQNMAYLADAIAALLGVSTVATFAESTAGVADGAKTGLATLVTGVCFLFAIPFAPVVSAVPPLASGPILCLLGALMCSAVMGIPWHDYEESMPAFVAMVTMPFTFSIGYGIIFGLLLWVAIQLLLIPLRLFRKQKPFVKFQELWAGVFVEGLEDEHSEAELDTDVGSSEGRRKPGKVGEASFGCPCLKGGEMVISLNEESFAFCVGRHITLCHQSRQRLSFFGRDARHRTITAMTKCGRSPPFVSLNGKLMAVGERVGSDDGSTHAAQISVLNIPKETGEKAESMDKDETLKVLHPTNKRLDIVDLAFTADGKNLVSLSSMPDATLSFWRWGAEKLMSSHDMQMPVNRVLGNPGNVAQFSVGGLSYLRLWDYNPNDHGLNENPSLFPLKQEKSMKVADHCWVLATFLCAATEDGRVVIFEDGAQREEVDVRAQIEKDESTGAKAAEKEQVMQLAKLRGEGPPMMETPPVRLTTITAWFQGFVVGGDQGYLGVFRVDSKAQVESVGTFRMPGEKAIMWNLSTSTEESSLVILSYEEHETESLSTDTRSRGNSASRQSTVSRASSAAAARPKPPCAKWSLHTFPMAQADLAGTGQLEVFAPVFRFGTHHGLVTAMKSAFSRHLIASVAEDKTLKLWNYPTEEQEAQMGFTPELSLQVSPYECATSVAVHPMGFQVAVILEDILRIFHLTPAQASRTQFDLALKNPGSVAYSNSGSMLAVSSDNDVALIDPWRAVVLHLFSGRGGGHVSVVNQVLFSEGDRMLLSSGLAPHGAIYGWDLTTAGRERCFEHVNKHASYTDLHFDSRQQLAVGCLQPEGHLSVMGHLSSPHFEIHADNKRNLYTSCCLAAAVGLLLAGTRQGSVRIFRWPYEAGAAFLTEISLHAHSITALTLSFDARYLFSGCEGGSVICCEVAQSTLDAQGVAQKVSAMELDQKIVRVRHGGLEKPAANQAQREDEKKARDLQQKLWESVRAISATTASLDDLMLIPKSYLTDVLNEIRELEDRMQFLKHESDHVLEQKESDLQEKLLTIQMERKQERAMADEKYDNLFVQLKQTSERHHQDMQEANTNFDSRHKKMQDQFEGTISKEYEKNSKLLDELQSLRDEFDEDKSKMLRAHEEQLLQLRSAQEQALRDWRTEYDKVCNLLKSDGLKFEEALRQQEFEYEHQIVEIQERERKALQDESEKSTTALKDGVSMKQTIGMLQNQVKAKEAELAEAAERQEDLRKKLQASQEMVEKARDPEIATTRTWLNWAFE
ncbi:unnamed protein product [Effrenium voratum]|nr:unnamed protein product [Effrenium voratum]